MIQTTSCCDNCEQQLHIAQDEDEDLLEQINSEGWYVVTQPDGEEAHFCGKRCLAVWACVNAGQEIGI